MIKKAMKSGSFSLIDLITSEGCIQLLRPFLYVPKIEMYQSEVIKETGIPKTRAITLLNLLTKHGLLKERVRAGSKFYRTEDGNPILKQLKILIIVSKLCELTRAYSDKNIEIYLFGSAAKGEDTIHSDIDLLVIADVEKETIIDLVNEIQNNVDREVNPVIYSSMGFANMANTDKAFYESIERYKIRVL